MFLVVFRQCTLDACFVEGISFIERYFCPPPIVKLELSRVVWLAGCDFSVLRDHGITMLLILWFYKPLERGHHDKDPSVVVGNEVIYANTWKALMITFYFQCKMNTGEKLTIGCFSSRKLIIWNNTPLSGEREVKGCVGRHRQQPVLCTQHSIECAVGTLQMTIDMKHTL